MQLLVIKETLIYFISLYYDYPRGMLSLKLYNEHSSPIVRIFPTVNLQAFPSMIA